MKKILQEESFLRKRPKVVCKDCSERTPGCHSMCQEYISFKKNLEDYNRQLKEERDAQAEWNDYRRHRSRRW